MVTPFIFTQHSLETNTNLGSIVRIKCVFHYLLIRKVIQILKKNIKSFFPIKLFDKLLPEICSEKLHNFLAVN